MPESIDHTVAFWKGIEVGTILFIATIVSAIVAYLVRVCERQSWAQSKENVWARALLKTVRAPVHYAIWISALILSVETVMDEIVLENWTTISTRLRHGAILILLTWFLFRWKREAEEILLSRRRPKNSLDKATINALSRLSNAVIIISAGLALMNIAGVPISTFLAVGGVGAIAISYSSSDIIKNFFGGLMIQTTRPFTVGDWISSPEKSIEGTVEHIGWYQTIIRTFEKRPLYVPNGLFPSIVVCNPSRMSNRRIRTNVGVRYDDIKQLPKILESIEKMLQEHPAIDQKMALMVHFVNFGASSLDINIYCFTKTRDWKQWRTEQQEIFFTVAKIIADHGAEIAFPTQVIKVESEPPPSIMA